MGKPHRKPPIVTSPTAKPSPGAAPSRSRGAVPTKWILRAGLAGIVLLAYANSFGLGLTGDANVIVGQDTRIQNATAENVGLILGKDYWWPKAGDVLYRPVTTLSYLVNYAVLGNGPSPAGYHIVNFLLHLLNVWLVYEIALFLLARPAPAFFAAALWAVHPIATEAVDNVVGRADLLASLAVFAALFLFLREARTTLRAALLIFAIATLGVFAKESATVLIGLMLLSDLAFGTAIRKRLPGYLAAAGSLVMFFAARAAVFASLPTPQTVYVDNIMRGLGFWQSRLTAIKVIGLDLWLLVFPWNLTSDRSYDQIRPALSTDPWVWISLAVIAATLALAFLLRRRVPLVFWLTGFLGIGLLPTSNLLIQIASPMAERFLYLPSVAFAIAVAALAWRYLPGRSSMAALAALLLLYTGRTWARNSDWQNNLTLALADTQTAPRSVRLRDMLAKSLYEQDPQHNIDRAIAEEEKAWDLVQRLPLDRSSDLAPANLGVYYAIKADSLPPAEARPWFEKSIAVLLRARAISREAEREFDAAQLAHRKPLARRQAFSLIYLYLGNDYLSLGRYSEALPELLYARVLNPGFTAGYNVIAAAYQGLGDMRDAALTMAQKQLVDGRLSEDSPDFCPAAAGLAQVYRESRTPDLALESRVAARCTTK
jgi:tetratricopeptide (TPR) repeat protein